MPHSANRGGFGGASGLATGGPGNGGGRDGAFGAALAQERRKAVMEQASRPQPKPSPHPANLLPQYEPPSAIFDHVQGLPYYGVAGPAIPPPMPTRRKASGYGGVARPSPIPFQKTKS
jgi:hypothetical protein